MLAFPSKSVERHVWECLHDSLIITLLQVMEVRYYFLNYNYLESTYIIEV